MLRAFDQLPLLRLGLAILLARAIYGEVIVASWFRGRFVHVLVKAGLTWCRDSLRFGIEHFVLIEDSIQRVACVLGGCSLSARISGGLAA